MVHRRLLTVLAIGAVMAGASAIGGAAGPAQKPLTGQEIAQRILSKGYVLTAPVRAGLEMMARGDRQFSSGLNVNGADVSTGPAARTKTANGGKQEDGNGLKNVLVNNPGEDSHQTDQTTQSETSVAVHGSNVVVGFNDSQLFLQPFLTAGSNLSGYAYSKDGGQSFTDGGGLPNPPGEQNLGDPWLGADRAGNFYYANLLININPERGQNFDVAVAKSTDGGKTFSPTKRVDTQPEATVLPFYSADKDALAVGRDPSVASHDNVYVAWDDFVFDPNTFTAKNGLPVSHSYDGGATWQVVYANQLVQPNFGCSFSQYIGANPVVDARNGTLYVATEKIAENNDACNFPAPPLAYSEVIFRSTDGGQHFGPETTISDVTTSSPTGLFKLGEHQYMRNLDFPSTGIDGAGNVYVTWNDGRSGNSHVLLSTSTDRGLTWTAPTAVTSGANDEMQPSLSVDASGLHDLYYMRNADNTLDVVVANSSNRGTTWSYKRVTSQSFPGVFTFPQLDPVIATAYMGDYIANVSGGGSQYFAWGDNRNIVTNFMWPQGRHDPDVFFARTSKGEDNQN
jgi:hypothetical protein